MPSASICEHGEFDHPDYCRVCYPNTTDPARRVSDDRDIVAQPYSKDELRVINELLSEIGGGSDPIGFVIKSYRYLVLQRDEYQAQASDARATIASLQAQLADYQTGMNTAVEVMVQAQTERRAAESRLAAQAEAMAKMREALREAVQAMHGVGPLSRPDASDTLDEIGMRAEAVLAALTKEGP